MNYVEEDARKNNSFADFTLAGHLGNRTLLFLLHMISLLTMISTIYVVHIHDTISPTSVHFRTDGKNTTQTRSSPMCNENDRKQM